jgi:hypothetical protein
MWSTERDHEVDKGGRSDGVSSQLMQAQRRVEKKRGLLLEVSARIESVYLVGDRSHDGEWFAVNDCTE